MTLDALARTLPNGFHDAEMATITIDYPRRELIMRVKVWVGDVGSPDVELYRSAIVTMTGLLFCIIEPPDPSYQDRLAETLTIDTGIVESLERPPSLKLPETTAVKAFTNWIYVYQWNSFIYVSAIEADLV